MAELERIHPLAGRRFANSFIQLEPAEPCERISLRAEAEAAPAIGKALGLSLPLRPKNSASADELVALWLGPDEWLILGPCGSGLAARLARLKKFSPSVVDVSHRNTAIIAEGSDAVLALNSGCPQNLSIQAFPQGACSRTIIGKSEVILLRESQDRFRIECWRSFSDYVWNFLVDAARANSA